VRTSCMHDKPEDALLAIGLGHSDEVVRVLDRVIAGWQGGITDLKREWDVALGDSGLRMAHGTEHYCREHSREEREFHVFLLRDAKSPH
jgi:hypothetical protein